MKYSNDQNIPAVSIIIATYNRLRDVDLCLESIFTSTYINFEVIVVDNASTDSTSEFLEKKYKNKLKLIKSETNLMAGGGRNLGAKYARGNYLLFIDSDNVIDGEMVRELVNFCKNLKQVGMVGPLMYYYEDKNRICWAGATINLWTSKAKYIGIGEIDCGQYKKVREVGHIPNVFMIKKEVWKSVGGIDELFGIMYEESDLAERIKNNGFKLYIIPSAKTWHNLPAGNRNPLRAIGETQKRVYLISRNRIVFMKKNCNILQLVCFAILFLPLFTLFYEYKLIKLRQYKFAGQYIRGVWDGIMLKIKRQGC